MAAAYSMTNMSLTGAAARNLRFVGFANFTKLFRDPQFFDAMMRTVWFVILGGILGQEVIGFFMAYLLRTHGPTFRKVVGFTTMIAWCVPMVVAAYVFISFFEDRGTLNILVQLFGATPISWLYEFPMACVIIATIWKGTAYATLMFQASLDNIPTEINESARLDGANEWQILRHIVVPMLRSTIGTVSMIVTLGCIGSFGLPYAMLKGGPSNLTTTLSIYMYKKAFIAYQIGYGTAIAIIMLVIGAIFSLVYVKILNEKKSKKAKKGVAVK